MTNSPDQTIAKDNFAQFKTANYPNLSNDDAFEVFAMNLILKHYGADHSDVERGLVSGTDDGGVDGFYIFLNGRELIESDSTRLTRRQTALKGLQTGASVDVIVIQAKNQSNWDTNVFPKIESSLRAIFDESQTAANLRSFPLNDDMVEKAETWRKLRRKIAMLAPVFNFHVYYISFAKQSEVNNYMATKSRQLKSWLTHNLPTESNVSVNYVGDAEIVTRLRASTDFVAKLSLAKLPIREANALVGLVSIKDYLKFLRNDNTKVIRDEMFAVNVRDYAGSNVRVNDAIGKTLANNSESLFWWLNNGITIIADKASNPVELDWILTNPLIVNGLQTSHVIHEQDLARAISRKRLSQSLLVRVITESDAEVRESIISGTNNQTAIASLQLHANEEKQLRIEEFLGASGWYYERRRYQYRGTGVPANRIRNMTEVGQAVMAYRLLQPDTARARPATLLGSTAGWTKIFDPSESEELYLRALNTLEKVDAYLRTELAKEISDDPTNCRYYLVAGYSLRSSRVRELDDFQRIPSTQLKQNPSASTLSDLHELLIGVVRKLDDGKSALDRIYKGGKLRSVYFDAILRMNREDS